MLNKIQYISQGNTAQQQLDHIRKVLDLGYRWIQLRFKHLEENALLPVAATVQRLCAGYGATFIVNDHVAVARAVNADGVHLGLSDTAVAVAREVLGAGKIIGGTANTLQDVRRRVAEGCDYIGLGPYRFTTTKEKLSPVLGREGYQQIMSALSPGERKIPVYAIGGILAEDIEALLQTGVYGIAVSGLLTHSFQKIDL